MNNLFLTEYFDWSVRRSSHLDRLLNLPLRGRTSRRVDTARVVDWAFGRILGHVPAATRSGVSTSIEQRINMYHLLQQTIVYEVPGDVVELGCNEGQSAVIMQRLIEEHGSDKRLHVYDSFQGLPPTSSVDGDVYASGDLGTTADVVLTNFSKHGFRHPEIHAGWFEDVLPHGLPDTLSFAHLDGDLYDSILTSLRFVYPRMSAGAVCLIDDYCDPSIDPHGWNELPGVKAACDEFLADKAEEMSVLYAGVYSHAFFRKL